MSKIKIFSLGGLNEIGKNMYVVEVNDDIFVFDAGLKYADDNMLGVDYIIDGGQTMNPSTEDFVAAIKKCNAKKIFILPNNSNIVMAAQQACDVAPEGVEARVIPTKTIPQGLVACMMFNPESEMDDNENEMNEFLRYIDQR